MKLDKLWDVVIIAILSLIVVWDCQAAPQVTMTSGRYYVTVQGEVVGGYYNATHTAYAAAITESFRCDCEVVITQPDVRVNTEQEIVVVDPEPVELGDVLLTWSSPTSREDGSALLPDEISGYGLVKEPDSPNEDVVVVSTQTNEYIDDELPSGTYRYAIYTITNDGLNSQRTQTIEVTL